MVNYSSLRYWCWPFKKTVCPPPIDHFQQPSSQRQDKGRPGEWCWHQWMQRLESNRSLWVYQLVVFFKTTQKNPLFGFIKAVLKAWDIKSVWRCFSLFPSAARSIYLTVLFDCLIIITCVTSFTLCTRSVINGIQLQLVGKLSSVVMSDLRCGIIVWCISFHSGIKWS